MAFEDKTLTCVECGQPFTHSAEDQALFAQRGYTNEPKRCPECRQNRRTRDTGWSSTGGGGFGRGRREMYPVTCAQCGKETEVPFQPRGDRPVYCSDCYSRIGATRTRRF